MRVRLPVFASCVVSLLLVKFPGQQAVNNNVIYREHYCESIKYYCLFDTSVDKGLIQ